MELLTQQSSASILCGCFCAPVSMEISSGGVAAPMVRREPHGRGVGVAARYLNELNNAALMCCLHPYCHSA